MEPVLAGLTLDHHLMPVVPMPAHTVQRLLLDEHGVKLLLGQLALVPAARLGLALTLGPGLGVGPLLLARVPTAG